MVRIIALFTVLAVSGCAGPLNSNEQHSGAPMIRAEVATVCQINKAETAGTGRARTVSITASIRYDFEYGYQLWDHDCESGPHVENLLPIGFPPGTSRWIPPNEFPELAKLHSDAFLRAAYDRKKGIYCRCIGDITYPHGVATFALRSAEIYLK